MSSPLVTTDWLENHLDDAGIRIIELRGKVLPPTEPPPHYFSDRTGYEAAHIPMSVYVDWQTDIVEPGSPSNDIASPGRFSSLMEQLGVSNSSTIVVSDDAASMFACRMRWALRFYGHEDVFVLDGGWTKWLAEGREVHSGPPTCERGCFMPAVNPNLSAVSNDILRGLEDKAMQLIDVRSPAEFSGKSSRARHGGHIPSAINLPRKSLVSDDMTLKPASELRTVLSEAGVDVKAQDTVLYCNSGVSATYGMLAMELAGARNLRIYDGSWKEWGNDDALPRAT